MILAFLLTVVLAFIGTTSAQGAQAVLDDIHNATVLTGTWSSGAKHVMTGAVSFLLIRPLLFDLFCLPGFRKSCQYVVHLSINNRNFLLVVRIFPASLIFIWPTFYDFFSTNDGFYEISRYRFTSNGV